MKKIVSLIALFLFAANIEAQKYTEYDTIRGNEFSLNMAPILTALAGGTNDQSLVNLNFGYKHYFKNKLVLRTALVIFPHPYATYCTVNMQFDRTVGNKNIFHTSYYGGGMKLQLNIGVEKIFKVNRLIHGFGAEIFVNHKYQNYNDSYFYRPDSINSSNYFPFNDTTNYYVDSLGSYSYNTSIGIGLQIFYSLRYKIAKHWYASATIGPSLNFSVSTGTSYERSTKETRNGRTFNVDIPNVPIISDISICYRF